MNEKQLTHFQTILETRLEALLVRSGIALSELVSHTSQEIEYLDQVSLHTDRLMTLRIKSRESHLIKKIQTALLRIQNGSFGICEICGEEISLARLNARPVATKCIFCKTEEERLERIAG